jgi:hypothetical protein
VGFAAGNAAALTHGATSERQIRPVAARHRRNVLRQLRLRAGDLDPIAKGYLDLYCRTTAKVDLLDRFYAEHGLIRSDGSPQPSVAFYTSLVNSARLALARLESHLHARDPGLAGIEALIVEGRAIRERNGG